MQQYGYIRVSTKEQNPERQFLAMQGRGIPRKYIYLDKMSGKDFQRTAYQKLMKKLKKEVPDEFRHYYRLWTQGEITVRQAAEKLGMSSSTFYRRCKEEEKSSQKVDVLKQMRYTAVRARECITIDY